MPVEAAGGGDTAEKTLPACVATEDVCVKASAELGEEATVGDCIAAIDSPPILEGAEVTLVAEDGEPDIAGLVVTSEGLAWPERFDVSRVPDAKLVGWGLNTIDEERGEFDAIEPEEGVAVMVTVGAVTVIVVVGGHVSEAVVRRVYSSNKSSCATHQ